MHYETTDLPPADDEKTIRAMAHIEDVGDRLVEGVITVDEGAEELIKAGMDAHDAMDFLLWLKGRVARGEEKPRKAS